MTFSGKKTRSGRFLMSISGTVLFFLLVTSINAQTGSVNFSGSWAFNESKSTPAEGGFRMGAGSYVITQDGINLTVERTSTSPDGTERKTT